MEIYFQALKIINRVLVLTLRAVRFRLGKSNKKITPWIDFDPRRDFLVHMVINARDFNAPLPPLILEGELDTTAGVDERSDTSRCGWHARHLTPPLRLEGAGGVDYCRELISTLALADYCLTTRRSPERSTSKKWGTRTYRPSASVVWLWTDIIHWPSKRRKSMEWP